MQIKSSTTVREHILLKISSVHAKVKISQSKQMLGFESLSVDFPTGHFLEYNSRRCSFFKRNLIYDFLAN